jgi:hypothetical protein
MKFNDYRKLQPILKKIITPSIINKQRTNKSSLNILLRLLPIEDVESGDDDMPIKLLCKRNRYTQHKTSQSSTQDF